jgi:putative MATE family efflux protein
LADPRKAVTASALPIAIALLISQINSFVDAVWCSALGPAALSVIGLSAVLYLMIVGIGNGIGAGASVAVARHLGMGDRPGANQLAAQAILLIAVIAAIISPILLFVRIPLLSAMGAGPLINTASNYVIPFFVGAVVIMLNGVVAGLLRAEGANKKAMFVLVTGSVFNLILDPVFIFTLGMGVTGSPVATVLATGIASMVGVYWYMSGRTYVRPVFGRLRKHLLENIMVVGFPQTAELCIIAGMNLLLNLFIIRGGGPDGLAVYSMMGIFISMATIPAAAYASALMIASTVILTKKDYKKAWFVHWRTMVVVMTITITTAVLVFFTAEELVLAFTYSERTAHLRPEMVRALRIFITFTPMYILIPLGSSLLQTLRKVHVSATSSAMRKLFTLAVYAVASTVSLEAMYWGYWTSEVIGGIMMYSLGLYFFFKIKRAHETETAIPANAEARCDRKYVFRDNGCSAPHDKLQVVPAGLSSDESKSVCTPIAITDAPCLPENTVLADAAPTEETAEPKTPA